MKGVVGFAELPASRVLAEADPRTAIELATRYLLSPAEPDDLQRLMEAVDWSLMVLTRVSGEGSVLEQLRGVLATAPGSIRDPQAFRGLAQRLEVLAELDRSTRADHLYDWFRSQG